MDRVRSAEGDGWSIRDPAGRRPFVMTPWGFRIEVHPDDDEVVSELGAWETARPVDARLVVPEETVAAVRTGLATAFGPVPALSVESGDVDRPTVPTFTLGGESFPTADVVDVASLATANAED